MFVFLFLLLFEVVSAYTSIVIMCSRNTYYYIAQISVVRRRKKYYTYVYYIAYNSNIFLHLKIETTTKLSLLV